MPISIQQISYIHPDKEVLFSDLNFAISKGQKLGLVGNNGCGKTSLIRAVMNFVKHSGKCMLGEVQLENMSVRKRAGMISYIPQRTGISISMTVREVCLLGFNPQLHMLESYNPDMKYRADKAIDSVGLSGLYDADFLTLSEGQKQLCILARTLIEDSALLLLDEPDSALDFSNRHMLMKHIRNIISNNKCALMCIHSPELALEYCDRILLMKDGKIVSDIDVHAASLSEINEKMSLIYDNINVTECTDTKGNVHRIVLAL